ncbi:MAG TPA: response regulator, partial [Pseudomonadales bacterium]|nr:response regulator [Pseudomonadales bacterium]
MSSEKTEKAQKADRSEGAGLGHACVLLVEDHRDIAEMVYAHLEGCGYQVDYAADGVTALQFATDNAYDLIVLDLMLPRMDGVEVCRRLREEVR